jgi:cytochrome d ubiquinol oxidase subunit I
MGPDGVIRLTSLGALLTNPWAKVQYFHTMVGAAITGSFVMAGVGAFYALRGAHLEVAKRSLEVGTVAGFVFTILSVMPTGSAQALMVHDHQPVTFAAMEGHFHTQDRAALVFIGQPNMDTLTLDNPITMPGLLSFLTYDSWTATVKGLSDYPRDEWPQEVPLLYFCYHIMAGLGTIFIAIMTLAAFFLWRRTLLRRRWVLWILMLALPFPFIANTVGWMTAELGRQPWLVHGVLRTAEGSSANVSSGNVGFTLLGFVGLYALLGLMYFALLTRIVGLGPERTADGGPS